MTGAEQIRSVVTIGFTEDMARTVYFYFDRYEADGIVSIDAHGDGSLWLRNGPLGVPHFLGSAKPLGEQNA